MDPRDVLYDRLMKKYQYQDSPEFQAAENQRMGELAAADDRNNLMAALAQSGAQVGAIGGKVSDTAPVANMAKGLNATNDKYVGMQQAEDASRVKRDQMRMDLYEKLKAKELAAKTAATAKKTRQFQTLGRNVYSVDPDRPEDKILVGPAAEKDRLPPQPKEPSFQLTGTSETGDLIYVNPHTLEQKIVRLPEGSKVTKGPQDKAATEYQGKSAGFGRRMEGANAIFDDLVAKGFKPEGVSAGIERTVGKIPGGNKFMSSQTQKQAQAERDFINATLRQESGSSIRDEEFSNAENQYLPRYGDTPEVLEQKRRNRMQALESMKASAGPQWAKTPLVANPQLGPQEQLPPKQPSGTAYGAPAAQPSNVVRKVRVINNETGQAGSIPEEKVKAALDSGKFSLAQ